jgi:ketosteroid isomerase-like protein
MATLEERVRALEDEKAILETLVRYAQCMDQGDHGRDFVECFTESGVWWASIEGPWAGIAGSRHVGRADLGRFFHDIMRTRDSHPGKAKHYVVTPDISVVGDRASAETYHLEVSSYQEGPLITSMGRYVDEFVRCADGRWRIQERHLLREGAGAEAQKRATR